MNKRLPISATALHRTGQGERWDIYVQYGTVKNKYTAICWTAADAKLICDAINAKEVKP